MQSCVCVCVCVCVCGCHAHRQWLPLDKLYRLGLDDTVDKLRLVEGKKPNVRKSVHTAYSRAITHLSHVRGNANFNPSSYI